MLLFLALALCAVVHGNVKCKCDCDGDDAPPAFFPTNSTSCVENACRNVCNEDIYKYGSNTTEPCDGVRRSQCFDATCDDEEKYLECDLKSKPICDTYIAMAFGLKFNETELSRDEALQKALKEDKDLAKAFCDCSGAGLKCLKDGGCTRPERNTTDAKEAQGRAQCEDLCGADVCSGNGTNGAVMVFISTAAIVVATFVATMF
eukprot:TRINITY_DN5035_c0_g1_i1.p1 TRINITY_DN5035_c0_g1~~TRINITY_DN5035_c0_g1_i1.p1  ORF type:complete len:229 (-),score=44.71 TRINITY_DN5035_c0_g1_i1:42-653(-)